MANGLTAIENIVKVGYLNHKVDWWVRRENSMGYQRERTKESREPHITLNELFSLLLAQVDLLLSEYLSLYDIVITGGATTLELPYEMVAAVLTKHCPYS